MYYILLTIINIIEDDNFFFSVTFSKCLFTESQARNYLFEKFFFNYFQPLLIIAR